MTAKIVALLAAALLVGQPSPDPDPPEPPPGQAGGRPSAGGAPPQEGPRRGPRPPWMEDIDEKDVAEFVLMMKVARIAKTLELSEEETVILMRRLEEHQEEIDRLKTQHDAALEELKDAIRREAPGEELRRRLRACVELDERIAEMYVVGLQRVAQGLDPERQARMYVLSKEFDERLRKMIERVRNRHGGPGGGMRRPGGPGPRPGGGMESRRPGGPWRRPGGGPQQQEPAPGAPDAGE